jgi:DNA-binding Lrp family transcriptional regulator
VDDLDRQLIGLLRANARTPVAALAKSLQVARGTVQNHLARLERDGAIAGYTVRLRTKDEDRGVVALTMLAVEGNHVERVLKSLRGDPAVTALHTTNGRWDVVAELRADTLEEFDRVLSRIRRIEGVANSETNLLLSSHKY